MSGERFECDVCGRMRTGAAHICSYCHNAVCDRCWHSQADKGHMEAEHRHEMAADEGSYYRGDEDVNE